MAQLGPSTIHGDLVVTGETTTSDDIVINDNAPTLFLKHKDGDSAMIQCNEGYLYFLRGGTNTKTWTQIGSEWPLKITLSNNDALFGGSVTAVGNVTAYSDERVKENLETINDAVFKISTLTGYTFDRTDRDTDRETGLIAQEVQKVLPEAVTENEDGMLALAYGNLAGLFVEAIKEQDKTIKEQQDTINKQEERLIKLEERMERLQNGKSN